MPIGIPLLLHQALILVLGCFPTEPFIGAGRTDLKRSDVIPSYERRGEEVCGHVAAPMRVGKKHVYHDFVD